jgi:hypothetical protein
MLLSFILKNDIWVISLLKISKLLDTLLDL